MAPLEEIGRIHQLARTGKMSEAFLAACALAGQHTDTVDATRLAMDLGLRVHGPQGPDGIAQTMAKDHAGSPAAGYAACYAHVCAGRLDAARTETEARLAEQPDAVDLGLLLAEIHHRQSGAVEAIACLQDLLSRRPDTPRYHATMATLHAQDGQLEAAVDHAAKARALGLASVANDQLLGQVLCRLERYDEASEVLEHSNRAAPENFATLAYLSVVRHAHGNGMGALEAVGQAIEQRPFSVRGPDAGTTASLTVVVVENCDPSFFRRPNILNYNDRNFAGYLTASDMRMVHTPLTPVAPHYLDRAGIRPDVVLNNAVMPEALADKQREFYGAFKSHYQDAGVPVVNGLDAVDASGREQNSHRFEAETGFIMPRLHKIAPAMAPADGIIADIESKFTWPVLVHHPKTSLAQGTRKFDGPDALREAIIDMTMPEYLVTQFHECRDDEGVSRQYRIVVIDGEPFVERANSQEGFITDDTLRQTPAWQERGFDKVEQAFLADPDGALGFDWKSVFAPIIEKTPLDIYGFDFSVTRDGVPVVFEINAAMNLFNLNDAQALPYLADLYQKLNDRTVAYLKTKAGKPA
ncbi:MAG: tetratricopeptide repeat protein [Pseudomonadota bacterium]